MSTQFMERFKGKTGSVTRKGDLASAAIKSVPVNPNPHQRDNKQQKPLQVRQPTFLGQKPVPVVRSKKPAELVLGQLVAPKSKSDPGKAENPAPIPQSKLKRSVAAAGCENTKTLCARSASLSELPPLKYRPYTLREYVRIKPVKYYTLGGLGVELGGPEWERRTQARKKMREFAKSVALSHKEALYMIRPRFPERGLGNCVRGCLLAQRNADAKIGPQCSAIVTEPGMRY